MHTLICVTFSSSWCQGLAATSACGSSWTFLFTFSRPHEDSFGPGIRLVSSESLRPHGDSFGPGIRPAMHTLICVTFSSPWCQGLAETSACGSSQNFLFTFSRPHVDSFGPGIRPVSSESLRPHGDTFGPWHPSSLSVSSLSASRYFRPLVTHRALCEVS